MIRTITEVVVWDGWMEEKKGEEKGMEEVVICRLPCFASR